MTILQRTMAFAAMTLSLAGLVGHSSAVHASDLDRVAVASPASSPDNPLIPAMVPVADARIAPQSATVEPLPGQPLAVDTVEFASLAEAVAANAGDTIDEAQRCLAGAIYYESKGEPLAGQLAVANVIINRSKSGRFPPDVCSVVTQRGQFSFVRDGQIPSIDQGRAAYRTALAVARVALAAAWNSPAPKALFFNTAARRPGGNLIKIAMIGNHVFYR